MRLVGLILLVVVGLYATGVGAMALYQRHLIYPGAFSERIRRLAQDGVTRPSGVAAITLDTADGEILRAYWNPPKPGCGVVLSFHGNGSLPEPHAERFSTGPWRENGWGMLAIAYRGYPGSTGSPSEDGLIPDGIAAYLYAAEHAPRAPILLHGHSLGTAVAVAIAERAPHLGLYLEAPFDSLTHLVKLHYPIAPSKPLLRDTFRSDKRIRNGTEPVLIVQGDRDPVVQPKLALKLAAAAGPRAQVEMIAGDHMSILGVRDVEAEAAFRARIGSGCAQRPTDSANPKG